MIPKPVKKEKAPYRIPRRSKKRAAQERKYLKMRKIFLEGKRCAVFPHLPATEVHHVRGRIGVRLLDENYWLAVSREGHVFIEENPRVAYEKGWSILRTL
jgi:hypothetical protein